MPSSSDKVTEGETYTPSAQVRNATVDLLLQHQTAQPDPRATPQLPFASITVLAIGNKIDVGAVVGYGAPHKIPTTNVDSRLPITHPHAAPTAMRWAVAKDGIPEGFATKCVLVGLAWAEVDIKEETHEWADIEGATLESKESGYAKIRFKPSGTGVKWCLLQLGFNVATAEDMSECICPVYELLTRLIARVETLENA